MSGISQDDIAAFEEKTQEAREAASEFGRRQRKGLPSDRLANGSEGEALVGQGIRAMEITLELQRQVMLSLYAEIQARGTDAMRLHHSDSKYSEAEQ